jgi:DNA polymerase-1
LIAPGLFPALYSTTEPCPRLFLIDGSSYIFRAFYAIPSLSNSTGLPTNAILGFTNLLCRFLKQYQPDYIAVALDTGHDTFRNQLFAPYKGNRPEVPRSLILQFPYFRKVLEGLKLPLLELFGYEADDIIATLCTLMAGKGCEVIVVSSDKDLMQLVSEGIKLLDGAKDCWIGAEDIKLKFGVEAKKVVEVMGLMGDSVDNIPGVKGVGAKTATALIQQFHTLENLFDHLDDVEKMTLRGAARLRKILEGDRNNAFLSRSLATVRRDVPIDIQLEQLKFGGFDEEKLRTLFTELEFTNLITLLEHGRL